MGTMPYSLWPQERTLVEAARQGEAWYGKMLPPTPEQLADPDFVQTMPVIRAETIRALCLGLWDDVTVDPRGVEVWGARIEGELDLSFGTACCPLRLLHCHFADRPNFAEATLSVLVLSGSRLERGLLGDGLRVQGGLFCRNGFAAIREVRLLGAEIGGDLDFSGATLDGKDVAALSANRIVVRGGMFCREGFTATGGVRLPDSQIGGYLDFTGAKLDGGNDPVLAADGASISGAFYCRDRFSATGAVSFRNAEVGGDLSFSNANISAHQGSAVIGIRARILGDVNCEELAAIGELDLLGIAIEGDLNLEGARLDGKDRYALRIEMAKVKNRLLCRNNFQARGAISLSDSEIGAYASFTDSTLRTNGREGIHRDSIHANRCNFMSNVFARGSFDIAGNASLVGVRVSAVFDWRPNNWEGRLNLAHAHVGQWYDNWTGSDWGCDGGPSINLTDFRYDGFLDETERTDAPSRIRWIQAALGDDFKPGPYEVLAQVLRRSGDDRGARDVLREKARHRVRHLAREDEARGKSRSSRLERLRAGLLPANLRRLWGTILDLSTGHGYRPWRGVIGLLGFLALGGVVFSANAPTPAGGPGILKPAVPVTIMQGLARATEDTAGGRTALPPEKWDKADTHAIHYVLPPEYTPFNAFWYSLDTLIPLISLGQERAWHPSPIGETWAEDPRGWAVLIYLYAHILMGWFLSTLTVVALTGLIKRDPDAP
ncbi:hypothetical protein [Rhodospira trueperi]|uniref:Uncharacterized protein n=1 Tax=Rhodospira trueperi TaxID=69960 RepID=A0A1G6YRQ1_9PROT|nr:hypothetical protein [Rhodospira trueperi]SDD92335.1 hypothetical protein SAMN05421720_10285 [Rhodospira trueperi]